MFPESARRLTAAGAGVLANLSNDAWFGHGPGRASSSTAVMRAIEARRYLVRATTTGVSAIIDPTGRLLARSAFGQPEVLSAIVRESHAVTPYQRWGDVLVWLALAFVIASTYQLLRNHRGERE